MSLEEVRARLDEALLALPAIADPSMPVREAEREIAAALHQVYAALAASADHAAFRVAVGGALERARDARAVLHAFGSDDAALVACLRAVSTAVKALKEVTHAPLEGPELPRPGARAPLLRASVDVPRLLELDRSVLVPAVPLPERADPEPPAEPAAAAPPPITTLEELRARMAAAKAAAAKLDAPKEPPPAASEPPAKKPPVTDADAERAHFGVALGEEEVLFDRARSCLEDLAMLGLQRRPLPIEPWHAPRTEARLLAKVDAIAACGADLLPKLVRLLDERPVADPDLTWALLFLFGSVAGDDALDEVRRLALLAPLDTAAMRAAVADALALAPHPGVVPLVRGWLRAAEAPRRAVAVRVLARRRALAPEEALEGARDEDRRVVLAATRALGQQDVPAATLRPLLAREEPQIVRAAMIAATERRSDLGLGHAVELVRQGRAAFASAAMLVALAGDADLKSVLEEDAASSGSRTLVRALGWYGHLGFVPYLIGRLGADDDGIRKSAVEALHRITGAALEPDAELPDYPREAPPFHPLFARAERPIALADAAEPWQALWDRHGRRADAALRYRYGRPYSPADDLDVLSDPQALPPTRFLCYVELVARTGGKLPFDPHDFIPRQRAQLAEWRAFAVGRRDLRPGSFANRLRT